MYTARVIGVSPISQMLDGTRGDFLLVDTDLDDRASASFYCDNKLSPLPQMGEVISWGIPHHLFQQVVYYRLQVVVQRGYARPT